MELEYTDTVLAPLVTDEIEATAMAAVDAIATFAEPWRTLLVVNRVYIIVCLEYASSNEDPFSLKLPFYRTEYDTFLTKANEITGSGSTPTTGSVLFSIPLERV